MPLQTNHYLPANTQNERNLTQTFFVMKATTG